MNEGSTLAEKCYFSGIAEAKLFEEINIILGSRPIKECVDKGYKWMATDTWTDHYDESVEVILTDDAPIIQREHADQILALGFGMIYFSKGEQCDVWTASSGPSSYSHREGSDEYPKLMKYREHIKLLSAFIRGFIDDEATPSDDLRKIGRELLTRLNLVNEK